MPAAMPGRKKHGRMTGAWNAAPPTSGENADRERIGVEDYGTCSGHNLGSQSKRRFRQ